jgi:hypothetical protein
MAIQNTGTYAGRAQDACTDHRTGHDGNGKRQAEALLKLAA